MNYLNMAQSVDSHKNPEMVITMIDLSGSMYDKDIKPSRRDAAIQANEEILRVKKELYPHDKIGVIGFQNTARFILKPTVVSGLHHLKGLVTDSGLQGGTNFTAPLTLAYDHFIGSPKSSTQNSFSKMIANLFFETEKKSVSQEKLQYQKRIILLTDGEHLANSNPLNIASKLKQSGVIIDCIGIGGCPENVDEALLKKIASKNPDGTIRYCFIGDKTTLLQKYKSLAHHLKAV